MQKTTSPDSHQYEYVARRSLFLLIGKVLLVEAALISLYWLGVLVLQFLDLESLRRIFFWIFHVVDLIIVVLMVLSWYVEKYTITPTQIILSKGLLVANRDVYNISNIESVKMNASFWGQVFRFSTLCLYAPTLNEEIWMNSIPRSQAEKYLNLIQKSIVREREEKIIPLSSQ